MYLKVKVFPKAKREELFETGEGKFEVHTKEPAQDNRANAAVAETLAQFLGVSVSKIRLISGHRKPNKVFELLP